MKIIKDEILVRILSDILVVLDEKMTHTDCHVSFIKTSIS